MSICDICGTDSNDGVKGVWLCSPKCVADYQRKRDKEREGSSNE